MTTLIVLVISLFWIASSIVLERRRRKTLRGFSQMVTRANAIRTGTDETFRRLFGMLADRTPEATASRHACRRFLEEVLVDKHPLRSDKWRGASIAVAYHYLRGPDSTVIILSKGGKQVWDNLRDDVTAGFQDVKQKTSWHLDSVISSQRYGKRKQRFMPALCEVPALMDWGASFGPPSIP